MPSSRRVGGYITTSQDANRDRHTGIGVLRHVLRHAINIVRDSFVFYDVNIPLERCGLLVTALLLFLE